MKVIVGSFVAGCCLSLASVASAQTVREQRQADGDYFEFSDDDLLGGGLDGNIARIRARPEAARALLIRPRVSFVQRMLQSVEDL